ncbi:unnamed protein product [Callosobruchus maculatus]|uniref:Uncharacterized protein n=1 Tax=Callosobruchus maculatus TaxID=64391 RepID=A0A653CTI9_CALMS|nr:unnamed protein product [Callosobruchus maculatus]VEN50327.1 unnamed protein product [Callosobruchus maculatus]VEN51146.1 unnamed protein product [Callosobruchus maculatus]VEN58143.1 unnamed protein product [Callosobruchus maculatus]
MQHLFTNWNQVLKRNEKTKGVSGISLSAEGKEDIGK